MNEESMDRRGELFSPAGAAAGEPGERSSPLHAAESLGHSEEGEARRGRRDPSAQEEERIAPEGTGRACRQCAAATAPAEPRDDREEGDAESGADAETENHSELRTPNPALARHLASLYVQGAELEREDPGFSLGEALRDPDFLRLTSPAVGVSVRRAWYALHGAERERQAARRAAEDAAAALTRSAARPREGGRGLSAGTLSAADPRALDRAARAALRQRVYDAAARGEKIYP